MAWRSRGLTPGGAPDFKIAHLLKLLTAEQAYHSTLHGFQVEVHCVGDFEEALLVRDLPFAVREEAGVVGFLRVSALLGSLGLLRGVRGGALRGAGRGLLRGVGGGRRAGEGRGLRGIGGGRGAGRCSTV